MSNRSRVQALGAVFFVPFLLNLPLGWRSLGDGEFLSFFLYLAVGLAGFGLLKESFGKESRQKWPYALAGGMLAYQCFDLGKDALSNFRGFGFNSLSQTVGTVFAAWCCLLCAWFLMQMLEKKADFSKSNSLPAVATSWGLGVVATLSGLNQIFSLRLDGFFGTLSALGFGLVILGLGVMLVRGKQPHLVCYTLGLLVAGQSMWTLWTNDFIRLLKSMPGMTLSLYGIFLSIAFVGLVASWALGAEVARKLPQR